MLKAIAVDVSPSTITLIRQYCSRIDLIQLNKSFGNPSEALKYLRKFPADVVFLDFQLPGFSAAKFIAELPQNMLVIGLSATGKYAQDGFELQILDYLVKPIEFERFHQAVKKAQEFSQFMVKQDISVAKTIYIRADYSLKKINVRDILYIEALDDYLKVHMLNQKTIVAKMTMKAILEKLNADEFVRVHRSFIVPVNRINLIRKKMISIDGVKIPIGLSYEKEIMKKINQ